MLVVLPLIGFCCLGFAYAQATRKQKPLPEWRRIFLAAAVLWGVVLTGITEILSFFTALTFGWDVALWLLISVTALAIALWQRGRPGLAPHLIFAPQRALLAVKRAFSASSYLGGLLCAVALLVATLGMVAWIAPPNTWDSMTYHMPRVMHWIQNQSVAFYPTNIIRQLHQPPWAEYAMLHLQLLSGSDAFANGVEWFSFVGCIVAASLLARQLGADWRGQVFAAITAATIPMGILQASSTQNDLVVAFWLLCAISFLFAYQVQPNWGDAAATAASLGLALLTKGTAYVFALPFLLWFGLWGLRVLRWQVWKPVLALGLGALLLNAAFYARNLNLFGSPLGPGDATTLYTNGSFSPKALASNVVRNLSLQIGTPSQRINTTLEHWIRRLLAFLNINPDNSLTTWHGTVFQINGADGTWAHEAVAGNLLLTLLIVVVIALCFFMRRLRQQRWLLAYIVALVGAFLIFSLYLKWQPWGSRLLLPLCVIATPLCGTVLAAIPAKKLANAVPVLLLLAALPWVLLNQSRPLIGSQSILTTPRIDQYFVNRPNIEAPYLGAVHFIQASGCSQIGIAISGQDGWGYPIGLDAWEYPFWVLLNPSGQGSVQIEHVNITTDSAPLATQAPFSSFHPCAIIAERFLSEQGSTLSSNGRGYIQAWSSGPIDDTFTVDVFVPGPGEADAASSYPWRTARLT
jgi:4-amino-4-deoxy-L-arabinose transferase-like glycosyltransferase